MCELKSIKGCNICKHYNTSKIPITCSIGCDDIMYKWWTNNVNVNNNTHINNLIPCFTPLMIN